jgi:hypothetical protein
MQQKTPPKRGFVFKCYLGHFNFNVMVRLGGEPFATQAVHLVRQGANGDTNNASPMQ